MALKRAKCDPNGQARSQEFAAEESCFEGWKQHQTILVQILIGPQQARSQKFAMGGTVFGGLGAKPPAAGSTGFWGRSPQRSKILHFFAKITLF